MTAPVIAAIEPCPLTTEQVWDRVRLLERAYRALCRDQIDAAHAGNQALVDELRPRVAEALAVWKEAKRSAPPKPQHGRQTRRDCALGHWADGDVECGPMCVRGHRQKDGFR